MATIEITAKAKFFSGFGLETLPVRVELPTADSSAKIRVWDRVAGHYTTCHALSGSAQKRLIRLAHEAAKAA